MTTILGDELHIICQCPATKGVLDKFAAKFRGLTRLLDLPPFASFKPDEMTQMVLGNPLPQVLQKGLKGFAYTLHMHVTSLHPAVVDVSSDDDAAASSDSNDDFSHYFPQASNQYPCHQMATCLYLLTQKDNRW